MSERPIFRKVSLERLSSPEQLDQLVQVTRPASWLALLGIVLLLAAATAWSVYGSIPTEVVGEGILLRQGGVSELVAASAGQVEDVLVGVGDPIAPGEVVVRMHQEQLLRRIDANRSRLEELEEEYRELRDDLARQLQLEAKNLERRRSTLDHGIQALERELTILHEHVAVQRDLMEHGLVTRQAVLDAEREANAVRDRLATMRLEREALELERMESEHRAEEQIEEKRRAIRDLKRDQTELQAQLEENSRVTSPHAGRVLELAVEGGDVVSPGTPLLSVEEDSEDLMAVLFVPARESKRMEPGMEARISPSSVRREEHGFLVGRVRRVAGFPSTERGMMQLLANEALVGRLLEGGPVLKVEITLEEDPKAINGYRWSSSNGPEFPIRSGTLATGSVKVREDPPIALAIPAFRKTLGL